MLAGGALCSGDIASRFELSAAGRVAASEDPARRQAGDGAGRQAQKRIYELNPEGVAELSDWVARIRAFWNPKLDALEEALEKETSHEQGRDRSRKRRAFCRALLDARRRVWQFLTDSALLPEWYGEAPSNRAKAARCR